MQAAGIGIPGLIDWEEGVCLLYFPTFLINGRTFHPQMAGRRVAVTGAVINDVRAITLAEKDLEQE